MEPGAPVPTNGTAYRLLELERRVGEIEKLSPAVTQQAVLDLKEDVKSMRGTLTWVIRTFVGLCITLSFAGITMVLMLTQGGSRGVHP